MPVASPQLASRVAQHNRRVAGEALVTLGLGLLTCALVFGGVYWLSVLGFLMCFRGIAFGGPWVAAGAVTGVFALVSVFSAWRRIDPIAEADIVVDRSPGRVVEDIVGLSMGIPIIRRDSLAGGAALLIGGPGNVFEAVAMWRDRIPAGADLVRDAQQALVACQQGLAAEGLRNPRSIALLYRLKMIKAVAQPNGKVTFELTQKGTDVLGSALRK